MTLPAATPRRSGIDLGMFLMPASDPDRPLADVLDWYQEVIVAADRLGYSEIWVGTHMTSKWERITAPQQMIARALDATRNVVMGTGVEVLYQQHPVTLALQLAQLDHMARGRLYFGFGAGATMTDHQVYGIDMPTSQAMTAEALQIILNVWQPGGPTEFRGKFWNCFPCDPMAAYHEDFTHGWHIQPYGPVEHRIALAGFQEKSPSLKLAAARGFIPMSLNINAEFLSSHWATIDEGARSAGRVPDRRRWRHAKEIFVAETNEAARKAVLDGFMGRFWSEYEFSYFAQKPALLEMYRKKGDDKSIKLTTEYLIDNDVWYVGDPEKVARQISDQFRQSGGFGTLLQMGMDYSDSDQRALWMRSMELLAKEVMPRVSNLTLPELAAA